MNARDLVRILGQMPDDAEVYVGGDPLHTVALSQTAVQHSYTEGWDLGQPRVVLGIEAGT